MAPDTDDRPVEGPRDVVERHIRDFNAADLERLVGGLTAEAVFRTGSDVVVRGTDELRRFFGRAFDEWALSLTVLRMVVEGSVVAVQLREDVSDGDFSSTEYKAGFYVVDGDRIASAEIYHDGLPPGTA